MALQRDSTITTETEATNQSKRIMQVIEEACCMVPELVIPKEEPVEVPICKLATGVHNTHAKMARF